MKTLEFTKQILVLVRLLNERQKTRRQLLRLDDTALKDIGITREEALREGSKQFWEQGENTEVKHAQRPQRILEA